MSDKDVELLALFVKGAMALHPNLDPDGDALEALASLESQNQALQEELATTQEAYRFKSREADANGREIENKAAILNAIEVLLDVDDEHTGWDRIVALQERIEQATRLLGWWNGSNPGEDYNTKLAVNTRAFLAGENVDVPALSPTQETDPE
jgi:hypothetical protein